MKVFNFFTYLSQKYWDDLTQKNISDKNFVFLGVLFNGFLSFIAMYAGTFGLITTFKNNYPFSSKIIGFVILLFGVYLFFAFVETIKRFRELKKNNEEE